MADNTTKKQLIIPQVMDDMISAGFPALLKFTPFAAVDNTLEGQPGDEIIIPSWGYIGDAKDVAEGEEVEVTQMSTSTKKMKVKKAMKSVGLTEEAIISGLGKPKDQAARQIGMSIAGKIEADVITALGTATLKHDTSSANISYEAIVDAVDKLEEEDNTEKFIFVHPNQVTTLRKDANFIDKGKYGNDVMMTGEIGMIAGCRVIKSRRTPISGSTFKNYIICTTPEVEDGTPSLPAVTIYLKQAPWTYVDFIAKKATYEITGCEHYGVGLTNESKVVELTTKKGK